MPVYEIACEACDRREELTVQIGRRDDVISGYGCACGNVGFRVVLHAPMSLIDNSFKPGVYHMLPTGQRFFKSEYDMRKACDEHGIIPCKGDQI